MTQTCIFCTGNFSEDQHGKGWIQCSVCFRRAHEDCAGNSYLNECLPYVLYQFGAPVWKEITTIVLIGFICNLVITVIYFMVNWDIDNFVRIAYTQCIELFAAICFYKGLGTPHLALEVEKLRKILWPYNELGPEVLVRIQKKIKLFQKIRIILTVYSMLTSCFCIPLSGDNGEFTVFSYIQGDIVMPRIVYLAISIMMVFGKLYMTNAIISMNSLTLFTINDIASHMLLLRKKLQSISKQYGKKDENYYDESYQRNIQKILKKCIFQHAIIVKYAKILKEEIEDVLMIVTIMGVLCLAFLYLKAKMERGIRFIINVILTQVIVVLLTCSYCNSGQMLMDEV
ncbi:uncharacterized protein LOC123684553 [Harmonia axyridis]|uniref:uncharacterized protein LOC123684553 n=1 Tax=Harmonia axyridis TaxID=115357 RepID=UPI001E279C9D|nr:uncharacterized protein LOC123684553 [Harmonia axyridis]